MTKRPHNYYANTTIQMATVESSIYQAGQNERSEERKKEPKHQNNDKILTTRYSPIKKKSNFQ
jgi:hypothetical protein